MKKRVLVALSGGVDSAVCAHILKERGYEVSGIMLRLYDKNESKDFLDAKALCEKLRIELHYPDFREYFREQVIDRFAREYLEGKTPNPCVDCNRYVKLPLVFKYAEEKGFDFVATGHYARVSFDDITARYKLLKGLDTKKDQSYVLYNLTQEYLSKLLLPIGEMSKDEVRRIAEENGFINADKKDSQDICFVEGNYYDYLKENCSVVLEAGDFITKEGKILGRHKGALCYTRGQRKGLGLALPEPMYVISKDMEKNTVTLGFNDDLFESEVYATDVNFVSVKEIKEPLEVMARVRYNMTEQKAKAEVLPDGRLRVTFEEPQRAVTEGQSLVVYLGDEVLCGGKIIR